MDYSQVVGNGFASVKKAILTLTANNQEIVTKLIETITHEPHLVRAYLQLEDAIQKKDWAKVFTELTVILKDPQTKELLHLLIRKQTQVIKQNREAAKSKLNTFLQNCDPETIPTLQSFVPLVYAFLELFSDFSTKRLLQGLLSELKISSEQLVQQTKKGLFQEPSPSQSPRS